MDQRCDQRSDSAIAGRPNGLRSRLPALHGDTRRARFLSPPNTHLFRGRTIDRHGGATIGRTNCRHRSKIVHSKTGQRSANVADEVAGGSGRVSEASQTDDVHEIAWEAADVLYFSLVAMLKNGVALEKVHQELARRMNRVVRRKNKLEPENN